MPTVVAHRCDHCEYEISSLHLPMSLVWVRRDGAQVPLHPHCWEEIKRDARVGA